MSSPAATVGAQAKVNLFLHILAREASGYHQLETLFCRLMLADDVLVRVGRGWNIDCDTTEAGPPEENLAYRAARLYAAERGWPTMLARIGIMRPLNHGKPAPEPAPRRKPAKKYKVVR